MRLPWVVKVALLVLGGGWRGGERASSFSPLPHHKFLGRPLSPQVYLWDKMKTPGVFA